jgi:eukaryotic-like serine/threonine-protein kinase
MEVGMFEVRAEPAVFPARQHPAELRAADDEGSFCGETWFDDPIAPPSPLGERYRLLGVLGRGGLGVVYCAHDLVLDECIAIKSLRPDLLENKGARNKLVREARLARRVTHPNVLRVHDLVSIGCGDEERVFVTMEHVAGTSLGEWIDERGPLPWPEAVAMVTALADGLSAVHAAGVLHCDVKTDNVIVALDGRVVLADFSIARCFGEHARREGTPEYMAPEQWCAGVVDQRTDVYGIGMMLLETLGGRGSGRCDPRRYRPVPDALGGLALRCVATDPARRFGSAAEVASALRQIRPTDSRKWWS